MTRRRTNSGVAIFPAICYALAFGKTIMSDSDKKRNRLETAGYWRTNLRIVAVLLVAWFVSSFLLSIVFVEPLNAIQIGGFPLGFWFAQQGTICIFIVLILIYALLMDRLDRKHGRKEKK